MRRDQDPGIVGYSFVKDKKEKAVCIECAIKKKLKFSYSAAVYEYDKDAVKLICEFCEDLLIY
jgi:hypothetical protein